jgi:hypothetical protein
MLAWNAIRSRKLSAIFSPDVALGKSGRSAIFPIFNYNLMTYSDEFFGRAHMAESRPPLPPFTLEAAT